MRSRRRRQLERQALEGIFAGLVEPGRLVFGPAAGEPAKIASFTDGSPPGSDASRLCASSPLPPRAQCSATRAAI